MTGKKRGRKPWIPTPEILQKIEQLAGQGMEEQWIARYFGMHPTTFCEYKAKKPELQEAIKSGRSKAYAYVTSKLFEHIQQGDKGALYFYLKCRYNWKDSPLIQINHEENHEHNNLNINLNSLSTHELKELATQSLQYLENQKQLKGKSNE